MRNSPKRAVWGKAKPSLADNESGAYPGGGGITSNGVDLALEEFNRIGLDAMLRKYGGGRSTRWLVEVGNRRYDQKLIARAAHVHEGLGELPPRGPGRFHANESRLHLSEVLGYSIVERIKATNANLGSPRATEPLARWLVGAAAHHTNLTYGEAASRLEKECGFGRIFPAVRMGVVVGEMQYRILELDEDAPLLNVLLVRNDTGEPGDEAREFLANRNPAEIRLEEEGVRTSHPELWTELVMQAAEEVYRFPDWDAVYGELFGRYVPDPQCTPAEDSRSPRGGGGEGANHRALRIWVMRHPKRIGRRFGSAKVETEKELLSGDRVDIVFTTARELLAIEVKSRDSNWYDLRRGIFQCIKYQAVLQAQEQSGRSVNSLLVSECRLSADLTRLAKDLGVSYSQVNLRG